MYPFVGAAFVYGSNTMDDGSNDFTVNETIIRLTGGVLYFLNDNVGVKAAAVYDMISDEADVSGAEAVDGSQFGVEVGFSIFLD